MQEIRDPRQISSDSETIMQKGMNFILFSADERENKLWTVTIQIINIQKKIIRKVSTIRISAQVS